MIRCRFSGQNMKSLPISKMNLRDKLRSNILICLRPFNRTNSACSEMAKKSEAPQKFFSRSSKLIMKIHLVRSCKRTEVFGLKASNIFSKKEDFSTVICLEKRVETSTLLFCWLSSITPNVFLRVSNVSLRGQHNTKFDYLIGHIGILFTLLC